MNDKTAELYIYLGQRITLHSGKEISCGREKTAELRKVNNYHRRAELRPKDTANKVKRNSIVLKVLKPMEYKQMYIYIYMCVCSKTFEQ